MEKLREGKSLSRIQPNGDKVLVKCLIKASPIKLAEGAQTTIERLVVIGVGDSVPLHIDIGQDVFVFDLDRNSFIGKSKLQELKEFEGNMYGDAKYCYALISYYEIRAIYKNELSKDELELKKIVDQQIKDKYEVKLTNEN